VPELVAEDSTNAAHRYVSVASATCGRAGGASSRRRSTSSTLSLTRRAPRTRRGRSLPSRMAFRISEVDTASRSAACFDEIQRGAGLFTPSGFMIGAREFA